MSIQTTPELYWENIVQIEALACEPILSNHAQIQAVRLLTVDTELTPHVDSCTVCMVRHVIALQTSKNTSCLVIVVTIKEGRGDRSYGACGCLALFDSELVEKNILVVP